MSTTTPTRVPLGDLRAEFLDSGLTLNEVARRLGWYRTSAARHGRRREIPDGSRVARTLGLAAYDRGHGCGIGHRSSVRRSTADRVAMSDERKVQIVSDGTPQGTRVLADGVPLKHVTRVEFSVKLDEPARARVEILLPEASYRGPAEVRLAEDSRREARELRGPLWWRALCSAADVLGTLGALVDPADRGTVSWCEDDTLRIARVRRPLDDRRRPRDRRAPSRTTRSSA